MAALAEPGTSGEDVLKAQKLLNKAAQATIVPENGTLDKATQNAFKQF